MQRRPEALLAAAPLMDFRYRGGLGHCPAIADHLLPTIATAAIVPFCTVLAIGHPTAGTPAAGGRCGQRGGKLFR